jgi:hypothetical protein
MNVIELPSERTSQMARRSLRLNELKRPRIRRARRLLVRKFLRDLTEAGIEVPGGI